MAQESYCDFRSFVQFSKLGLVGSEKRVCSREKNPLSFPRWKFESNPHGRRKKNHPVLYDPIYKMKQRIKIMLSVSLSLKIQSESRFDSAIGYPNSTNLKVQIGFGPKIWLIVQNLRPIQFFSGSRIGPFEGVRFGFQSPKRDWIKSTTISEISDRKIIVSE